MDDLAASDDLQLARVKHYYHQQLQRKENMILRLISRQKIILSDLRQQLDAVPSAAQTPMYLDLNTKLEHLEKEHTTVMREYTNNHKFVASLMNSCSSPSTSFSTNVAPPSPVSPGSSINIRPQIPSMVNRDSFPANAASAPALTNALLSCPTTTPTVRPELKSSTITHGFSRSKSMTNSSYRMKHLSEQNDSNNQQNIVSPASGPSSDPSISLPSPSTPSTHTYTRSNSSGRQTAGCKLIKTLPSPTNCPFKASDSFVENRPWTFSFNFPSTSIPTSCYQSTNPYQGWSSSSASTNCSTHVVEASDRLTDVNNVVLQSIHHSVVDQSSAPILPPTPAWLTSSSPSESDDAYAPAFDWNSSERLPDFSVLG